LEASILGCQSIDLSAEFVECMLAGECFDPFPAEILLIFLQAGNRVVAGLRPAA